LMVLWMTLSINHASTMMSIICSRGITSVGTCSSFFCSHPTKSNRASKIRNAICFFMYAKIRKFFLKSKNPALKCGIFLLSNSIEFIFCQRGHCLLNFRRLSMNLLMNGFLSNFLLNSYFRLVLSCWGLSSFCCLSCWKNC